MASLPLTAVDLQLRPSRPEDSAMVGTTITPPARLSALEWSVVAMAEGDKLSSIREESRYTRALRGLFGIKRVNRLANDQLEALRRVTVLAWHYGWNVPKSEFKAFLAAGYSSDQFELVQQSIARARATRRRRRPQ